VAMSLYPCACSVRPYHLTLHLPRGTLSSDVTDVAVCQFCLVTFRWMTRSQWRTGQQRVVSSCHVQLSFVLPLVNMPLSSTRRCAQ